VITPDVVVAVGVLPQALNARAMIKLRQHTERKVEILLETRINMLLQIQRVLLALPGADKTERTNGKNSRIEQAGHRWKTL
jgi:hypothetical protein